MADLTVPVPANQNTAPVSAPAATQPTTPNAQQATPAVDQRPTAEQIEAFVAADRRSREEVFRAKQESERWQREHNSVQSEISRLRAIEEALKDPTRRYSVMEQYGGDVVNYAEAVAKGKNVSPTEEIAQLREEIKALKEKTNQVESGMSVGMYTRGLDKTLSDPKYAPIIEYNRIMGSDLNLEGAARVAIENHLAPDVAADQMLEFCSAKLTSLRAAFGQQAAPAQATTPEPAAIDQSKPKPTLTNAMGTMSAPISTKHMTWDERVAAAMELAKQQDREQGRTQ